MFWFSYKSTVWNKSVLGTPKVSQNSRNFPMFSIYYFGKETTKPKKISNYSQLLKCKGTWSAEGFYVGQVRLSLPKSQVVHPSGRNLYQYLLHETTKNISTTPFSTPSRIPQHLLSRGPGRTI